MKAAIRERYGPPEVVEVREVDTPTPKDDEVLVRVRAASVNRADLDYLGPRPGFIRPMIGMRAPRDPRMGIDVAGVVESVGADVTGFEAGDRVYADLLAFGAGAFAEFVVRAGAGVRQDPRRVVIRGCRDPASLGDPRDPGAAAPRRSHGPARRHGS